jgi:hypothetical protein
VRWEHWLLLPWWGRHVPSRCPSQSNNLYLVCSEDGVQLLHTQRRVVVPEKGRQMWLQQQNPHTKLQQHTEISLHHISLPSLFLTHNLFHCLHLLFLVFTDHFHVNNDMTGTTCNQIHWQRNQCKDIARSFLYMLSASRPYRTDIFCVSDSRQLSGLFWEIWPVQFYLELSILTTDKIYSKSL